MNSLIKVIVSLLVSSLFNVSIASEKKHELFAFPDKYMLRVGAYFIDSTNTQLVLNPSGGAVGTTIDFNRDLGGKTQQTIPRIDAYFRFDERHRIDFTAFSVNRDASKSLVIDINIEDESFSIGDVVKSTIKYTLYKAAYNYSFYHSPRVELSLSAGLNIVSYDMTYSTVAKGLAVDAGVTAPLPVFGLRMGYAITPKWSVHYVVESLFIEIDKKLRATVLNFEINTEYKIFNNFALGAGIARIGMDAEVDAVNWRGSITDAYNGYTLFGTFYF